VSVTILHGDCRTLMQAVWRVDEGTRRRVAEAIVMEPTLHRLGLSIDEGLSIADAALDAAGIGAGAELTDGQIGNLTGSVTWPPR
jgi:hypothetical protein